MGITERLIEDMTGLFYYIQIKSVDFPPFYKRKSPEIPKDNFFVNIVQQELQLWVSSCLERKNSIKEAVIKGKHTHSGHVTLLMEEFDKKILKHIAFTDNSELRDSISIVYTLDWPRFYISIGYLNKCVVTLTTDLAVKIKL